MPDFLISGDFLLPSANAAPIEGGAVAIEGGRIVEVGPRDDLLRRHGGARQIGGEGAVVLPGLVNLHAHSHSSLTRGSAEDVPLERWLREYVEPEQRRLSDEDAYAAALATYAECLLGGTTSILDMCVRAEPAGRAAETLGIRATLAPYTADNLDFLPSLADNERLLNEFAGGELVHVWVGLHSIYNCSERMMADGAELAKRYGVGLHTHCAETQGEARFTRERYGATPVRHLAKLGLLGPHLVLAHCVWLEPEEIELLAGSGAAIAHCPASNAKLGSGIAPVTDFKAAGINVGLGTDGAKSNNRLDMFETMKLACLLQRARAGDVLALSSADAFAMATEHAARALLPSPAEVGDGCPGRLEPGAHADVVVLRWDKPHLGVLHDASFLLPNLVFAATPADVSHVVVGGRIVVDDGRLTNGDLDHILTQAKEAGQRLRRR